MVWIWKMIWQQFFQQPMNQKKHNTALQPTSALMRLLG